MNYKNHKEKIVLGTKYLLDEEYEKATKEIKFDGKAFDLTGLVEKSRVC
ncbi:MAG: hypothetical protein PUE01_09555 [Clostridiaceae bacterium]|nr:hypothetical protein [Clostridiaceae bacterium]